MNVEPRVRDYSTYLPPNDYSERQDGRPHPMALIEANETANAARLRVKESLWIPPGAKFHNSNYLMDGCVAANLCAAYGYYKKAAKQLISFRYQQKDSGMVMGVKHPPNKIPHTNIDFSINPEIWLSSEPFDGHDYSQSPDWARSILKLYKAAANNPAISPDQAIDPDKFLRSTYYRADMFYEYLINTREIAEGDPRVFLIHAHEDNRDSAPEHDKWKQAELERHFGKIALLLQRQPRTGEHMPTRINNLNRITDYAGAIALNVSGFKAGWEPNRIRENNEFIDVWFNCILQRNYQAMSELSEIIGQNEKAAMYKQKAVLLEQKIIEMHYFKNARNGDGAYCSMWNGEPMYNDTCGTMISSILPNYPEAHLQSNIKLYNSGFDTPYGPPTVATDNVETYDPHHEELHRPWRGSNWGIASHLYMQAMHYQSTRSDIPKYLREQCLDNLYDVHEKNLAIVELDGGYAEYNDPVTGYAQRRDLTFGHMFGAARHFPINDY